MAPPKAQRAMLALVALGVPLSGWGALYPQNTALQIGPVALALPVAVWGLRRWPLSDAAVCGACGFVLLHLVAARWSYSYTPYERWARPLGIDIDAAFGFHRNMFDRLVHFAFGWLMCPLVAEIACVYGRMRRGWALVFAVLAVFAVSSLYEIFEWLLTMGLSPADAGAYNGEQGDIYDSQKDMACANGAALLVLPWAARRLRMRQV